MTQASKTEDLLTRRVTFYKNTIIPFVFLSKFCIITRTISLRGRLQVPRKIENNYTKFWKENKQYYGIF